MDQLQVPPVSASADTVGTYRTPTSVRVPRYPAADQDRKTPRRVGGLRDQRHALLDRPLADALRLFGVVSI